MTDHKAGANHDAPSPTPSLRPNQHEENLQPRHERKAWRGTVSLAVAETTSWGILYYSFGVLLAPFETAFAASRVTISGAFSLALLTSGLAARPVGHSLERWGVRHVMTLGALLGIVSYGLLAIVTNLTALYLVCAKRIRSSARKNKTDDASQYPARVFELTCDDLAQAHGSAHSETDS